MIDHIISRIPEWQGRQVAAAPIAGGLTNTNYRVEVDGTPWFVRVPGPSTELLAIDRANEAHNTRAAAQAGVGPRVVHHLPDLNAMVLAFIPAQTMSIASLQAEGMPTRVGRALKQLHSGPRFLHDFNMFRLVETYLKLVDERSMPIPDGFRELLPAVARIEQAMAAHPVATVPCHNDLLAENYLDDGQRLWIVDYEYSGNNDPCFELGNTCQEQLYDEARIVEMCTAYFGAPYPNKLARMKLSMVMSDVGWTLWAAISARISVIEFDFWGWAVERCARAVAKVEGPEFEGWLGTVAKLPV